MSDILRYYHISAQKWDVDEVGDLRAPDSETRGYGESDVHRLSVTPTVCQCLLATPGDDELFHIYEVMVTDPEEPAEDEEHLVRDKEASGEKWVVQRHLDEAPGHKIPVKYLGMVRRSQGIHIFFKAYFQARRLTLTSEEEDCLWDKSGSEWKPLLMSGSGQMQRLVANYRKSNA